MIIKSDKQPSKQDQIIKSRFISRLKLHPNLRQQAQQSNLLNRRPSVLKISSSKKRRNSHENISWRSRLLLRPVQSTSNSKQKLNITSQSTQFLRSSSSSRSKILNFSNKPIRQRKDRNLSELISQQQRQQVILKVKDNQEKDILELLDIQEQFYQEVRILQQFKKLKLFTK